MVCPLFAPRQNTLLAKPRQGGPLGFQPGKGNCSSSQIRGSTQPSRNPKGWFELANSSSTPQGSCCPEIKDESSSHRPRGKLCLRACGWSNGNRLQERRLADRDRARESHPARVSVPSVARLLGHVLGFSITETVALRLDPLVLLSERLPSWVPPLPVSGRPAEGAIPLPEARRPRSPQGHRSPPAPRQR